MTLPTLRSIEYVVGIDEAGRGPLAGPVAVGAVVISRPYNNPILKLGKDSKMMSPKSRDIVFAELRKAKNAGLIDHQVSLVGPELIDKKGINSAIRISIQRVIKRLNLPPHKTLVLLDGGLKAPNHFLYQKTIIRGDKSEPVIGLASVVAKVTRDKAMVRMSKIYPDFDFDIHKGYGTLSHRQKIKKLGPCEIHRLSFLKNIQKAG